MKKLFEIPELFTLDGESFTGEEKFSTLGDQPTACNPGCEAGCWPGCDSGTGPIDEM